MNELFNVKDKVVVITGGAGILGKGIAAYLAKEGAKVVVLDRSEEASPLSGLGRKLAGTHCGSVHLRRFVSFFFCRYDRFL